MAVYKNNKNGTLDPIATNIQYVDQPLEEFVTQGEMEQSLLTKQDTLQYETMPAASEDWENKIVQYVGVTDSSYVNGHFYKCVSDGAVAPNYSWIEASGIIEYDIMPSFEDLAELPNGTIFKTLGFYDKKDGHGGYYTITTSATTARGGIQLNTEGTVKYLIAWDTPQGKATNYIDICRYGVREYGIGSVSFSNITVENTYARRNSEIISKLIEGGRGSYIQFPIGRFFFESPLSFTGNNAYGIRGSSSPSGMKPASITGYGQSVGATTLYFPFLTNGQVAITTSSSNLENFEVIGNPNTYSFTIKRLNLPIDPSTVVEETIATSGGTAVKCTGISKTDAGYIKNVNVVDFYVGATAAIANIYISNFYARSCHTGLSVGNDNKCIGIYGFDCDTLLEIRGSLVSATQVRVDSAIHAVRIINGNAITLTDIDGDFCTDSLIAVGNGGSGKIVQQGTFTGIHGRCCTLKSYDSLTETSPDVRDLASTSGYGLIRVENGCSFKDNTIIVNRIGDTNPFDGKSGEPTNYRTPNILLTFGSLSTEVERNNFILNDSTILNDSDILKIFQTKNGVSSKFDIASGTYFIDGTTIKSQVVAKSIEDYQTNYENGINIKDYGAKGDGVADDSQALTNAMLAAVAANKSVILFPRGSYNLNHVATSIGTHFSFIGEGQELSEILNSNITATQGIECIGLTFNGGSERTFGGDGTVDSGTPRNVRQEPVIIICTPAVDCSVHFKKCVFKNAGTGLWALQNPHADPAHKFISDVIEDCTFENLVSEGMWHSLDIDDFRLLNSTFKNIGSAKVYTGGWRDAWVCAKVGDTSNTANRGATRAIVENNTFENLTTLDHPNNDSHSEEGYFFAFHGDYLELSNNSFKNLMGYGKDREGIYTKAKKSGHLHHNYIENAGVGGEGYLCCKQSKWPYNQRTMNIHDNIIIGDAGKGISSYGAAFIHNNTILIKNVAEALRILSGARKKVSICNNFISCGTDKFYHDGQEITNFHEHNSVVYTSNYDDVEFCNNYIALEDNFTDKDTLIVLVRFSSTTKSVIANGNTLFTNAWTRGIYVMNVSGTQSASTYVEACNNSISMIPANPRGEASYCRPIYIQMANANCRKTVKALNNEVGSWIETVIIDDEPVEILHSCSENSDCCVYCLFRDGDANSVVTFDTQQPDLTWVYSGTPLKVTYATFVNVPDESFVS